MYFFKNGSAEKQVSRPVIDYAKKFYFPFAKYTTVFFLYINVPKKVKQFPNNMFFFVLLIFQILIHSNCSCIYIYI